MKNASLSVIVSAAAACLAFTNFAHAQLLGVVQTFPDTTTTANPYIIYDHDAINSTTGLLRLVTGASTLATSTTTGGGSATQSYFSTGDAVPDAVLSIQIRNGSGGFSAGTFVNGAISIGYGNSTTAPRWRWEGTVTELGSRSGTNSIIDAIWTVTSDQYQNMPGNMGAFVNGYLSGSTGGIKISSSATWGTNNNFTNDWIYGLNPGVNTSLNSFRAGLTYANEVNSAISGDLFVAAIPEPEVTLIMLLGFALLVPMVRRRKSKN